MGYAIGTPGRAARLVLPDADAGEASEQCRAGEVAVPIAGTGFVTIAQDALTALPAARGADELLRQMRVRRYAALTGSDWTQLPDAPLTPEQREAWAIYRQALRDLPQTSGDPDLIEWPAPPAG